MIADYPLPWSTLSPDDFEELCMELASIHFNTDIISRYRKSGQAQDGIDIFGFDSPSNEFFCIQCKRVEAFGKSQLDEVVNKFKIGKFYNKATIFLVVVKHNLKDLEDQIIDYQSEFNQVNKRFICWGLNNLVQSLVKQYEIVLKYFGQHWAELHSHRGGIKKARISYPKIPDYLQLNISILEEFDIGKSDVRLSGNPTYLINLFKKTKPLTSRICIIGNPHQGKTSMLKQFAHEISTQEFAKTALFIDLNSHSNISIEQMITAKFGQWKEVPAKDLIVILDGLDEVQTEEIQNTISRITEFSSANELLDIIVAVRTIFFDTYHVSRKFKEFSFFEIQPPSYDEITRYLTSRLGAKNASLFLKHIYEHDMEGMISGPFGLKIMADEYKAGNQIPENKGKLVELLIKKSYSISGDRKTSGGIPFHEVSHQYGKILVKLAFLNQLLGTNGISHENLEDVFTQNEITLLKHSSIVSKLNGKWMFINAYYQEYIAGYGLLSFEIEDIYKFCIVGAHYKKIKIKWIQTLACYLSLSQKTDTQRQKIVELIENDNIELITNADGSVFTETFLSGCLQKILEKYKNSEKHPPFSIVDNTTIAFFFKTCTSKVSILKSFILPTNNTTVKSKCWSILCNTEIELEELNDLEIIAKVELGNAPSAYYAEDILEFLAIHKLGNEKMIEIAISHNEFIQNHTFRSAIYSLLTKLKLYDQYFQFAFDGIEILINHNRRISDTFSENNLLQLLLQTDKLANIKLILQRIANSDWRSFVHYNTSYKENFLKPFFDKIAGITKKEPILILWVIEYLISADPHFIKKEEPEALEFLNSTNSSFIPLRLNLLKHNTNIELKTSAYLQEDQISYLLFELEEGLIDISALKKLIYGLHFIGNNELSNVLMEQINVTTGNTAFTNEQDYSNKQLEFENLVRENDILYITSRTAFENGIISHFENQQRDTIEETKRLNDSIFNSPSVFLKLFLQRLRYRNHSMKMHRALKIIRDKDNYEWIRAEFINSQFEMQDEPFKEAALPILKDHYEKFINLADFRNNVKEVGTKTTYAYKETELTKIFASHQFPTSLQKKTEMIWFDRDNWHVNFSKPAKISLTQKIIDGLNESEKEIFSESIVEDLKNDIKINVVLQNHIDICRYLKIRQATPVLLELINKLPWPTTMLVRCLDTFLQLGGNKKSLLPKIQTASEFGNHTFFSFVNKLFFDFKSEFHPILTKCLNSETNDIEFKLYAAQYLAAGGYEIGFDFIIEQLRSSDEIDLRLNSKLNITNIDTAYGLKKLDTVIHRLLEKEYWETEDGKRDVHTKANIVWILESFANKSELDLIQVESFLKSCVEKFSQENSGSSYFSWQADRIVNTFRNQNTKPFSLAEASRICRSANWQFSI